MLDITAMRYYANATCLPASSLCPCGSFLPTHDSGYQPPVFTGFKGSEDGKCCSLCHELPSQHAQNPAALSGCPPHLQILCVRPQSHLAPPTTPNRPQQPERQSPTLTHVFPWPVFVQRLAEHVGQQRRRMGAQPSIPPSHQGPIPCQGTGSATASPHAPSTTTTTTFKPRHCSHPAGCSHRVCCIGGPPHSGNRGPDNGC